MTDKEEPFVSIVTPVYNGERYLESCIRSVLNQTHSNWEYVIANNCSTDSTLEIARHYAAQDDRIRVYNNPAFLSIIENWNKAVRQISPTSKYCKVIHADDELFPECIEKMVSVAEQNDKIGIVGSYILLGNEIRCVGIPYPRSIIPGRDICRAAFRGEFTVFGPPSVLLIRSDIIRSSKKFYDDTILYTDAEVCFRILQKHDFGFVHQVLSYIRLHGESESAQDLRSMAILEFLGMLRKYGPTVFERVEYEEVFKKRLNAYYRFLGKNVLLTRNKEFWKYHINGSKHRGSPFSYKKLIAGILHETICSLLHLENTFKRINARLSN